MLWLDYRAITLCMGQRWESARRWTIYVLWFFDSLPFIWWALSFKLLWEDNPMWMSDVSLWIGYIYLLTVVARSPLMLSLAYIRRWWSHGVTLLLGVGALYLFIHGMLITRTDYDVRHVILRSHRLPHSFNGYRILQLSDLQYGTMIHPEQEMERIVDICNNQRADLVAFTGDLINVRREEITPSIKHQMRRLHARDGVVAVTGNHDRGVYVRDTLTITTASTTAAVIDIMQEAEWNVLDDDSAYIRRGVDSISVIGISFSPILQEERHSSSLPDIGIAKAYRRVDPSSFNITLSHVPQLWDNILDESTADLTLAGHVHSMEIKLPIGKRGLSPAQLLYKRWSGLYEKQGRWLYINDGIAAAMFPMRLGARPEITIIELYSE